MTILFDHSAVSKNTMATKGILRPSLRDMNSKIGQVVADSTIPYRFKGDLNTSMRKIATNIVLFPRMHFLSLFQSKTTDNKETSSAFSPCNEFLSNNLNASKDIMTIYSGVRSGRQS